MVRECKDPHIHAQHNGGTTPPEFSGCITSKSDPHAVMPETVAAIGRVKCVCAKPDSEDELIHYSREDRKRAMCGRAVVELRPYLKVKWGAAGLQWCEQCEAAIAAGSE
jgi:hypothetical protein